MEQVETIQHVFFQQTQGVRKGWLNRVDTPKVSPVFVIDPLLFLSTDITESEMHHSPSQPCTGNTDGCRVQS